MNQEFLSKVRDSEQTVVFCIATKLQQNCNKILKIVLSPAETWKILILGIEDFDENTANVAGIQEIQI